MQFAAVQRKEVAMRCPRCFWALYDGRIGQNPDCYCYGKHLRERIELTNKEAAKKIAALNK